jgi:hypothetical protein
MLLRALRRKIAAVRLAGLRREAAAALRGCAGHCRQTRARDRSSLAVPGPRPGPHRPAVGALVSSSLAEFSGPSESRRRARPGHAGPTGPLRLLRLVDLEPSGLGGCAAACASVPVLSAVAGGLGSRRSRRGPVDLSLAKSRVSLALLALRLLFSRFACHVSRFACFRRAQHPECHVPPPVN